jgi:hypothetical protein
MIDTKARGGLRGNHGAAAVHEAAVRVSFAHPVGSGIEIDLHHNTQTALLRKAHQKIKVLEVELVRPGLGRCPVHPALDGVEAHGLDLVQIFSPALRAAGVHVFKHGSARLAAAVPHRHWIEGIAARGQSALRATSQRKLSEQKNTDRGFKKACEFHGRNLKTKIMIVKRVAPTVRSARAELMVSTK